MPENKISISKIMTDICEKAGISQAVVAGIIKRAPAAVSNRFKDDTFTTDEVFRIAEALNCGFVLRCKNASESYNISDNDELYSVLNWDDEMLKNMEITKSTYVSRLKSKNFKFADVIRALSVNYELDVSIDTSDMTDKETLYSEYYKSNLSEEARERKNARQREYAKKTDYSSQKKYKKENSKIYSFEFMRNTEADLINQLESQENKAGYIKQLIRADIKNNAQK